MPRRRE